MTNNFVFETDFAAKKMHIEREFSAPVEKVWAAWTDAAQLDKWWGSRPYAAETQSMDFSVGGTWQYAMVGPGGDKHPSQSKFTAIEGGSRFVAETGVGTWDNRFIALGDKTKIITDISFDDEAMLKMMVDMGFEGGTATSFNQLEAVLAS